MPLKPRTGESRFKEAMDFEFMSVVRPKKGDNFFRLIDGPIAVREVWYPYMGKDDETDEPKVINRSLRVNKKGSEILKLFANLDKKLAKEVMSAEAHKKYNSNFKPGKRYRYLGFDRDNDREQGKPTIVVIEVPYSVNEVLRTLQQEASKREAEYMRYGLLYMYDVIITKTVDPNKPAQFGTSYKTLPDNEDLPSVNGIKIPVELMYPDSDTTLDDIEGGLDNFFNEDELDAMEKFDGEIEAMFPPNTEEEIREILTDNSPVLNATRDDKVMFKGLSLLAEPEYEDYVTALEDKGFIAGFLNAPAQSDDGEEESEAASTMPGLKKRKKKKLKEVEEAEYEEVDEDEPDEDESEEAPKKKPNPLKNKKQSSSKKKKLFT